MPRPSNGSKSNAANRRNASRKKPTGFKDKNKIAQTLTPKELNEFLEELHNLPGRKRSLFGIQQLAAKRGIDISISAAKSFKNKTYADFVERLEGAREFAQGIAAIGSAEIGATLADAGAAIVSQKLLQMLMENKILDVPMDFNDLSLCISRIRTGDVQVKTLEAKLEDYKRLWEERDLKKQELLDKLKKARNPEGGISEESLEMIEAELSLF